MAVLEALAEASTVNAAFDYADIGALPHFNHDLYVDPLPHRCNACAARSLERTALSSHRRNITMAYPVS